MVPHPDPDEVRRAANGDPEARAALWRAHRQFAAAVLLAHRPPGADVEDLLQDVALGFVRGIGALREPERFRPWLRSIALNVARMAARRAGVRDDAGPDATGVRLELVPPRAADDAEADDRDEAQRALRLLGQLDAKYREPLVLRCLRGLSQAQIADALGVPETTVETRLARARRWLRDAMDGERERGRGQGSMTSADDARGTPWNRRASTS